MRRTRTGTRPILNRDSRRVLDLVRPVASIPTTGSAPRITWVPIAPRHVAPMAAEAALKSAVGDTIVVRRRAA